MKISTLLTKGFISYTKNELLEQDFHGCYISDLLSNVLRSALPEEALLTTLSNMNTVAVASLSNLPVVIFVEGKIPTKEMIQKANEEEIALLSTEELSSQVVKHLIELGAL